MKATDTFRNPQPGHNCAQAVANKYSELYSDHNIVETYAPYVGGRAPGGLCGALFAAKEALPDHAREIEEEFTKICGATTCRQIKTENKTSCHMCVDTADQLVEKYRNK
ncbi:MAG: C-GCAxxG-C-C family protein [Spirochaetales bacterium]|nr:C-GCAxxG-C-C family protein [Spirochaetales bacterium]